jgi:hypothetical protein
MPNKEAGLATVFAGLSVFLLVSWCIQFISGSNPLGSGLWYIVTRGLIYFSVYWLIFSVSLWRVSLFWLGFPVLLFLCSWLRMYWAFVFSVGLLVAMTKAWRADPSPEQKLPAVFFAVGAMFVLVWVSLSGAGGYGRQLTDYAMHNGRLADLVNFSWPVVYPDAPTHGGVATGGAKLLVAYSAYYLPAAAFGKLFGLPAAMEFMYFWTLTGCWLAYRWIVSLSGIKHPLLAALALIFFSGWDLVGASLSLLEVSDMPDAPADVLCRFVAWMFNGLCNAIFHGGTVDSPVFLDNWTFTVFDQSYWFGGYFSQTTSFYWAPHHVVGSWIVMALLLRCYQAGSVGSVALICGLLTLWSPLMVMATVIFPLTLFLMSARGRFSEWVTMPNVVGGLLSLLMFSYYASASAASNPMGFFSLKNWHDLYWFFVFHTIAWLIYALAIFTCAHGFSRGEKFFFLVLCLGFFLMSLVHYGSYNDLMVRSSAPFFFGMTIFLLKAIAAEQERACRWRAVLLMMMLVPASFSGLYNMTSSYLKRDEKVAAQSVAMHGAGWQFLGSMDSWYARYFSGHDHSVGGDYGISK